MTITLPETAAPTFIEPAGTPSGGAACASWCALKAPDYCQRTCKSDHSELPLSLHDAEPVRVYAVLSVDGQPGDPADATSQPVVNISLPDNAIEEMGGVEMTPAEAREFAYRVLEYADLAERA